MKSNDQTVKTSILKPLYKQQKKGTLKVQKIRSISSYFHKICVCLNYVDCVFVFLLSHTSKEP